MTLEYIPLEKTWIDISSAIANKKQPEAEVALRAAFGCGAKHSLRLNQPFIPPHIYILMVQDLLLFEGKTIQLAKEIWPGFDERLEEMKKQKQSTEKMFDPSKN